MSGPDEQDEQAAKTAREADQKAIMNDDLGSGRREAMRTADYRNRVVDTGRIMRGRECVHAGTEASSRAVANKSALAQWSNVKQIGASTEPDEINIANGQSHRVHLSKEMRAMRARQPSVSDEEGNEANKIPPIQSSTPRTRRPLYNDYPTPKRPRNSNISGGRPFYDNNSQAESDHARASTAQARTTGQPAALIRSHSNRSDFPLDPAVDPARRAYKYSGNSRNSNTYSRGDSTSPRHASPSTRGARSGVNRGGHLHPRQRRQLSATPPSNQNQLVQSQMAQIHRVITEAYPQSRQTNATAPSSVLTPASTGTAPARVSRGSTASGPAFSAWAVANLATNPVSEGFTTTNATAEASVAVTSVKVATTKLPEPETHESEGGRAPESLATELGAQPCKDVITTVIPNLMDIPIEEAARPPSPIPIRVVFNASSAAEVTKGASFASESATKPTKAAQQDTGAPLRSVTNTIVPVPELYQNSGRPGPLGATDARKQALASYDDFWKWKNETKPAQKSMGAPPRVSVDPPAPPAPRAARPAVKPTPLIVPLNGIAASTSTTPRSASLKPPTNGDQWTSPAQVALQDARTAVITAPPAAGRTSPTGSGVTELTECFGAFNLRAPPLEDPVEVIEMASGQVPIEEFCASLGLSREAVREMYRTQKAKKVMGKFKNPFDK